MILVSMERRDPIPYTMVLNNYTLVNSKFSGGDNQPPPPPWRRVTKKAQEDEG